MSYDKEKRKVYLEANKEKIKEKMKLYNQTTNEVRKAYKASYRKSNGDKISAYAKQHYEANKENVNEACKQYYRDNKLNISKRNKEYWKSNKETLIKKNKKYRIETYNDKRNIRRKTDVLFILRERISNNIRSSIKRKGYIKNSEYDVILGCTLIEFKAYLEGLFEHWMSWDNYGKFNNEFNFGWDIDHITPISSGKTEEEIYVLNHYTNLQPLCSKVNRQVKRDYLTYSGSRSISLSRTSISISK